VEATRKRIKVGITHYDASVTAGDSMHDLNIGFFVRENPKDFPNFLDGFLKDLQKFLDENYNK